MVCQWDNEYSGKDLNPLRRDPKFYQNSSPVWLVGDCDEKGVSLIALSEKEKDIPERVKEEQTDNRKVVQIIEGNHEEQCESRSQRLTWVEYQS